MLATEWNKVSSFSKCLLLQSFQSSAFKALGLADVPRTYSIIAETGGAELHGGKRDVQPQVCQVRKITRGQRDLLEEHPLHPPAVMLREEGRVRVNSGLVRFAPFHRVYGYKSFLSPPSRVFGMTPILLQAGMKTESSTSVNPQTTWC